MAKSLKDKTVKGVGWSAIDNVFQTGVTFLVSIVLARLLSPDDYGLIGIVAIFTTVSTALINGGFTTALIRKKDASEEDYCTAFYCNLGISLVLYVIIFFCAPLIADFFGREELVALTRVSSVGLVIASLALVQQTRLTKRIDFKSQTKITMVAAVTSGAVGIISAILGAGVWSLVAQQLTNHVLRTVMLWWVNKWVPSLTFSKASFVDLFGFGWKMMVSSVLESVWKELYQAVVGKFYSPATLGQYTRSKQFSKLFSQNLTHVVQRVTYPVLSDIQDDKERMIAAYRRIIKMTMFVTAISMFFLGAVAEPLIYCLIGPKWDQAALYLPFICVVGSTYPLQAINLNMLKVQGRSDLFLGLEIVKKIIAFGPLSVGAFVGIIPMLCTSICTSIIAYFLNSYYSGKLLGYSSWMQIKDIAPSYGMAVVIAAAVYFLKYLPITYWIVLPIQIIIGALLFVLLCKMFKVEEYGELVSMFRSLKKSARK